MQKVIDNLKPILLLITILAFGFFIGYKANQKEVNQNLAIVKNQQGIQEIVNYINKQTSADVEVKE